MFGFFYKISLEVISNSWEYFAFASKNVAPVRDQARMFSAEQINIWENNPVFCKGVTEPNGFGTWWHCVMVAQNKLLQKKSQGPREQ